MVFNNNFVPAGCKALYLNQTYHKVGMKITEAGPAASGWGCMLFTWSGSHKPFLFLMQMWLETAPQRASTPPAPGTKNTGVLIAED